MLNEFITYITAERRLSPLTVRNYRADIERFILYCGVSGDEFKPELLTSDDVRRWIVSLREHDGLKAATINRMVCSLRSLYRFLRKTGVVTKDPFIGINALRTPSRLPVYIPEGKMEHVVELLEQDEGQSDFISQRNSLILLLFYSTGIRLAELIGIRTSDFDDATRELRVRGKGDKERVIPILEFVGKKIVSYIEQIKSENICVSGGNFLFLTEKGAQISRTEVYNVVRAELERAGIKGKRSPHVLRHTFATHLLNQGADMREIQELLGHTSLGATQVYTHNSITQLKQIYNKAHPRAHDK